MQPKTKRRLAEAFMFLSIALMVLSAYSNTLNSAPALDDFSAFIHKKDIQWHELSFSNLLSTLQEKEFGWHRVIPMITFGMDYLLGRGKLTYFHITNIIIHILAFISVFFLARQMVRVASRKKLPNHTSLSSYYPYCIACLWALNPVQTSAVTYLVQRMASIQALFFITCVAFFLKGRLAHTEQQSLKHSMPCYLISLSAAACAFLSKQNSYMLPPMLLLTEIWFFQPDLLSTSLDRLRKSHWAFKLLVLLIAIVPCFILIQFLTGLQFGHRHFTMWERLLTQTRVVVWYMSLLLWPAPSRLSLEHDIPTSTSIFDPPSTLLSILLLSFLIWQIFQWRRRFPVITYGGLWFFVNLVIESSILPLELVFEHRLYLPSVGFFIAIVIGVVTFARYLSSTTLQRDLIILSCCSFFIVSSLFAFLTFSRNFAWQNPVLLQLDSAVKAPNNPRAHSNLAIALLKAKQYEEAIKEGEKAIELGTSGYESYTVAANAIISGYLGLGQPEKAIERGEELMHDALKYDAGSLPFMCLNLADAYRRTGELIKAFTYASRGLSYIQRSDPEAYFKKYKTAYAMQLILKDATHEKIDLDGDGQFDPGEISEITWIARRFHRNGEHEIARALLDNNLAKNVDNVETHNLLKGMQEEQKLNRVQKEKWDFSKKYLYRPFSTFNICMAAAFVIQEKQLPSVFSKVGEYLLDHALQIQPESADAHLLRGWYYYSNEETEEALSEVMKAIEVDSDCAKNWIGLGFFRLKANPDRPQEAIAAFRKGLELYPGYSRRLDILDLISGLQKEGSTETPSLVNAQSREAAPSHTLPPTSALPFSGADKERISQLQHAVN